MDQSISPGSLWAAGVAADAGLRPPVDCAMIEAVVAGVVRTLDPEAVYLFGSRARGTHGPHSDIDLLVVLQPRDLRVDDDRALRQALADVSGVDVDLLAVTADELASMDAGNWYRQLVDHGRCLYARSAQ